MPEDPPLLSVIVPVYNDSEKLESCVAALSRQSYPRDRYEVIVVDNGSDREHMAVVERVCRDVRLAHESRASSYAARNLGISMARGDVLAFTDADCIPERDWLLKGVKYLESRKNLGLVVGRVELYYKDRDGPNVFELYDSIVHFRQEEWATKYHFGCTANVFTYKAVVDDVGAFDPDLKSGGDAEWGRRIFARGYEQLFARDLLIEHPARDSLDLLVKKGVRIIGGFVDREKKRGVPLRTILEREWRAHKRLHRHIAKKSESLGPPTRASLHAICAVVQMARAVELARLQVFGTSARS
jgi:glycosyltransferase involved in cell wall biosynthesis